MGKENDEIIDRCKWSAKLLNNEKSHPHKVNAEDVSPPKIDQKRKNNYNFILYIQSYYYELMSRSYWSLNDDMTTRTCSLLWYNADPYLEIFNAKHLHLLNSSP